MPDGQKVMLWVAQGFGVGRIPVAPGTFGSLVGLGWFGLLLASGSGLMLIAGSMAGFAVSVWLCGVAERRLGRKDPASVVLDEITAMPVCFLAWLGVRAWKSGALPSVRDVFSQEHWLAVVAIFVAFRLFDVVKPWPVRQSQSLPGGWGITVDDFLAAVYVNLAALLICVGFE